MTATTLNLPRIATPAARRRTVMEVIADWFEPIDVAGHAYLAQSTDHDEYARRSRDLQEAQACAMRMFSHGAW